MTQIKICGIKRIEDIPVLNEYKPEYVGFVFAESKRQITAEVARELKSKLCTTIQTVGVFVDHDINEVELLLTQGVIDIAQLHGKEDESYISYLQEKTGTPVIKAVAVTDINDILAWKNSKVDFLLLDQGAGGTGKTFCWDILNQLAQAEDFTKPFFLAGGVHLDNVDAALKFYPFAIDVSSGVECDGVKSPVKIKQLIQRIRYWNDFERSL